MCNPPRACRTLLLGNYDVNVLEVALRRHGKVSRRCCRCCTHGVWAAHLVLPIACPSHLPHYNSISTAALLQELHWCDLRDTAFQQLDLDACLGLILNVQASRLWGVGCGCVAPALWMGCCCVCTAPGCGRCPGLHAPLGATPDCCHCSAVQGTGVVSRLLGGRHWLALGRVGGRWWNLDSSLEAPQLVASFCDDGGSSSGSGMPAKSPTTAATTSQGGEGGAGDGSSRGQAAALAAAAGTAAGDAAAVRRFLAQQVQQRDAKVFRVADCALASHPLPSDDLAVSTDT